MMARGLKTAIAALLFLLFIFALLFTCLAGVINDRGLFLRGYEKMDIEASIGISAPDCTEALMRLVDYMELRADSIQLTVSENGQSVDMYNEREIMHMVDVRALYQGFNALRWAGVAALVLLACYFILTKDKKALLPLYARGFLYAAGAFMTVVLIVGVYALLDFNSFWINFHLLFFDNDLWLLDYATSRMIRICPLELFSGIVLQFALIFALIMCVLTALCRAYLRRLRKKEAA